MRITFLTRSLNYGGAERQLVLLAKNLKKRGKFVRVVVFYSNGPLESELKQNDIQVDGVGKKSRWNIVGFYFRLLSLIKKGNPDVIHSYLGTPNIFLTLLKPFLRKSVIIWGIRASFIDIKKYDLATRVVFKIESWLSVIPNGIIVNSNAGFNTCIERGFSKSKLTVIQNGIDTDRFYPDEELRIKMKSMWGIEVKKKLIGLVGRLDPMKDHYTFLKAAEIFLKKNRDIHFICVGGGEQAYLNRLQEYCIELGITQCVTWIGASNDMVSVYNALDILTSSSYGEGFSNVIGEAMACGVPCVVTDVGDSKIIVGDYGAVVPIKDARALVRGWWGVLESTNSRDLIRERIVRNYSVHSLLEKTELYLMDVIKKSI